MDELETRILALENRNARVEAEKAWEISRMRKIAIFLLTFLTFAIYHVVNGSHNTLTSA